MKKKLLCAAAYVLFVLIAGSFGSCEKDCKTCRLNQYDNDNNLIVEGDPYEYCGAELIAIEAKDPETIGGVTSKYDCN
jgi:hypothetical protein